MGGSAIAVHFETPEVAAYSVMEAVRKLGPDGEAATIDGILAFGDRPAVTASYVARGLGIAYNHPAAVEACRSKLRMREMFRDAGMRGPWFRSDGAVAGFGAGAAWDFISVRAEADVAVGESAEWFARNRGKSFWQRRADSEAFGLPGDSRAS